MAPAKAHKKRKAAELDVENDENVERHSKIKANKENSILQRTYKLEVMPRAKKFGNLLSCGQNEVGQLGFNEDVVEKTRPAVVIDVTKTKVVDISAGGMHSLYLTENGEVWSFGCNDEGALGRNTSEDGSEYEPQKVDLPGECLRITAGDSHSAFLLDDGRVYACGSFRDSHGTMGLNIKGKQQYPIEVVPTERFVDIKSGADHLVLLSNKGKVYTVGCAEQGQLGRISMRSSGGEQRKGKTTFLEPGLLNSFKIKFVDAIWATTYCTFVRNRANGSIYGFGLNNYFQLGIKNELSEQIFHPMLTPFTDVKSITGGQHHTLVMKTDDKCYAIGRKDYGRLGLGKLDVEAIDELTPIKALDKLDILELECGEACSFAVTKDGKAYCWGMGSNQQLGIGSDDDKDEPTLLTGAQVKDRQVVRISSGGQHTIFIAAEKSSK